MCTYSDAIINTIDNTQNIVWFWFFSLQSLSSIHSSSGAGCGCSFIGRPLLLWLPSHLLRIRGIGASGLPLFGWCIFTGGGSLTLTNGLSSELPGEVGVICHLGCGGSLNLINGLSLELHTQFFHPQDTHSSTGLKPQVTPSSIIGATVLFAIFLEGGGSLKITFAFCFSFFVSSLFLFASSALFFDLSRSADLMSTDACRAISLTFSKNTPSSLIDFGLELILLLHDMVTVHTQLCGVQGLSEPHVELRLLFHATLLEFADLLQDPRPTRLADERCADQRCPARCSTLGHWLLNTRSLKLNGIRKIPMICSIKKTSIRQTESWL